MRPRSAAVRAWVSGVAKRHPGQAQRARVPSTGMHGALPTRISGCRASAGKWRGRTTSGRAWRIIVTRPMVRDGMIPGVGPRRDHRIVVGPARPSFPVETRREATRPFPMELLAPFATDFSTKSSHA